MRCALLKLSEIAVFPLEQPLTPTLSADGRGSLLFRFSSMIG
jgi:hypothetical protein